MELDTIFFIAKHYYMARGCSWTKIPKNDDNRYNWVFSSKRTGNIKELRGCPEMYKYDGQMPDCSHYGRIMDDIHPEKALKKAIAKSMAKNMDLDIKKDKMEVLADKILDGTLTITEE